MNNVLREAIVKHIFSNFSIIPSTFINFKKTHSLMSKDLLLSSKINILLEDGTTTKNNIWGCQITAEQQEIKILLGDCSQEIDIPEYCLLIQLKGLPSYGVYLVCSDQVDSEALIACTLDGKDWLECQTYLQATFLAGMEQIREAGLSFKKCLDYKDQYDMLISFINYQSDIYRVKYEGKEN